METVAQNSRFAAHEQQITQLQHDVAEIKSSLKVLEAHRVESIKFQRFVLDWMQNQDSKSLTPGSTSSSLIVQLEAIVSKSEVRSVGQEKWRSHIPRDSLSSDSVSQLPSSGALGAKVSSQSDGIPIGHGSIIASSSRSLSSLLHSLSLSAQSEAIIFRSAENSWGHGCLLSQRAHRVITSNFQGTLGSKLIMGPSIVQTNVVGCVSSELGLLHEHIFSTALFQFLPFHSTHVFTKNQSDLDIAVVVSVKPSVGSASRVTNVSAGHLSISIASVQFGANRVTATYQWKPPWSLFSLVSRVPTSHFWVVHGQCRPPEDSTKETAAGF